MLSRRRRHVGAGRAERRPNTQYTRLSSSCLMRTFQALLQGCLFEPLPHTVPGNLRLLHFSPLLSFHDLMHFPLSRWADYSSWLDHEFPGHGNNVPQIPVVARPGIALGKGVQASNACHASTEMCHSASLSREPAAGV